MTKYEELIDALKQDRPQDAERLEEEIDIIIHKLKFLPVENFPNTVVLSQSSNFEVSGSTELAEKVKIAGGSLMGDNSINPDVIVIIQDDESLYSELPILLSQPHFQKSKAAATNRIYIVHDADFGMNDTQYLSDIEILAEILQPKYFFYGHEGEDWVKFDLN